MKVEVSWYPFASRSRKGRSGGLGSGGGGGSGIGSVGSVGRFYELKIPIGKANLRLSERKDGSRAGSNARARR